MSQYLLEQHRHVFAAWCAARAAQRGLSGGSVPVLRAALEASSLPAIIADPQHWPSTAAEYDMAHIVWCQEVLASLEAAGVHTTYGRAAKLVAIYVKTLVVVGGDADTPLGRMAHPPLDRLLLQALSKSDAGTSNSRALWAATAWSFLDQPAYFALVQTLRSAGLDDPFWQIERFWLP